MSEATTDERQIAEWGRQFPDGNIGLLAGPESFDVIDVDPEKGGLDTERALQEEGKLWPDTPIQLTRSGGRHILVQHHELIVTGTNRLGPGIDFRGAGGYIVGAPSMVRDPKTGRIGKYSWPYWPKAGIAPAPAWLIEHLGAEAVRREAEAEERARNTVEVDLAKVPERERRRYEGTAQSILARVTRDLSQKAKPGRGNDLYKYAGFLAPYVRAGFIKEDKVRAELEGACQANGLKAENGLRDVRTTMTRAFDRSISKLPDLDKLGDRPYQRAA